MVTGQLMVPVEETTGEALPEDRSAVSSLPEEPEAPEAVAARTGWDGLTAVAEGQMYGFDDNLVSRPGPRLVEGLDTIAQILHPELF